MPVSRLRHDERFLEPSEPDDFTRLLQLAEAFKSPDSIRKQIADLAKATKDHLEAQADLEAAQRKADASLAAAKSEAEKILADAKAAADKLHGAAVKDRNDAALHLAKAETDRKQAADLLSDRRRRLQEADKALTA